MIGLDIGTMNLVSAREEVNMNTINYTYLRNMFLMVSKESIGTFDLSRIIHAELNDQIVILAEDAFNFANIFNKQVNRPMKNGLISPSEIDAIDVLTVMISHLIGKTTEPNIKCVYSCPAESIDTENNIIYHREVLKRIISSLGYEPHPFNEAVAIVYSNCQNDNFTGLSFSFGAGMTNVSLVFKAIPVFNFSINRGGDWIDLNTASSIGSIPNRVTVVKENNLDLENYKIGNKKEVRIREALTHYYKELIVYTITQTITKINELQDIQFPHSLPIIVSGGTSKPLNFVNFFKTLISSQLDDIPFNISEIRSAINPLMAVAEGCLIKAKSL